MMRLISAELRKVWGSRFFLLCLAVLLCINIFLLWFGTGHTPGNVPSIAYRTLESEISCMTMEEMDTFLHESLTRTESLLHIDRVLREEAYAGGRQNESLREQYADDFTSCYTLYASGQYLHYGNTLSQEYRFLKTITVEFDQARNYESFLDSIEQKAKQLSAISIFANSTHSYDSENIRITEQAYRDMSGTSIHYYPQKGLMTALDFELTDVVTVFAMLLIATVLVRAERDNGLLTLVRSTSAGRLHTAIAKLAALAVSLALILIGLYGINLLYCGGLYGIGPLNRTIQSVPQLMRSTWKLTVGEYLGCFLLAKWLAAFICGVWVMLAMLYAKHLFTGALGALALVGVNFFIRTIIPATSRMNVFKYANLVSFLRTNELLGGYRNLYWFDHPVPLLLVEIAAAVLFFIVFVSAFCTIFSCCYFIPANRRIGRKRFIRHTPAFTTLARQEAYKLLIVQRGALLLALFAGFQIYSAATKVHYIDANEIYYQYYMKHVEGPLTQEKADWLNAASEEFQPIYLLHAAVKEKRISVQEYQMIMQGYASLQQKMNLFQRVAAKARGLGEKPRMQMVYETGWLDLFDIQDTQDLYDTLFLAMLCSLCFSGLFAMEKQTGMIKVIRTTPLGHEETVRKKLWLTAVVVCILTLLSLLPRFWSVVRDYGLGAWLAPVYSIPEYRSAPEIPLFMMTALLVLSRFAAVLCMALVTLVLSQKLGNTFGTLFVSMLIFSLPPLLSISGLTNAKWLSPYPLFHICALFSINAQSIGIMFFLIVLAICYLCVEYLFEHFR